MSDIQCIPFHEDELYAVVDEQTGKEVPSSPFEQECRLWMRAWLTRLRAAHTQEHLDDLLELFQFHFAAKALEAPSYAEGVDLLQLAKDFARESHHGNVVPRRLLLSIERLLWTKAMQDERDPYEYDLYPLFPDVVNSLIPGARIIDVPFQRKDIPDFFVELPHYTAPVEIKRGEITNTHIKQLARYMKAYKTRHGYIIGRALKPNVTLRSGMYFCAWDKC